MKWYQVIECDNAVKNPLVCDSSNLEDIGLSANDFRVGKKFTQWGKKIIFIAENKLNDGIPDDALQNYLMVPIFSERLIIELERISVKGIQFIPIKLIRSENSTICGYQIANFTEMVDAVDYDKSIYRRFSDDFPNPDKRGKIAAFSKFVLRKDLLEDKDIVRLTDYKRRFFVSESFKQMFEGKKFTGYSFSSIELT